MAPANNVSGSIVTSYYVTFANNPQATFAKAAATADTGVTTTTNLDHTIPAANQNKTVYYKISSLNKAGTSRKFSDAKGLLAAGLPGLPGALAQTEFPSGTTIKLSWTKSDPSAKAPATSHADMVVSKYTIQSATTKDAADADYKD